MFFVKLVIPIIIVLILSIGIVLAVIFGVENEKAVIPQSSDNTTLTSQDAQSIAEEAYIFGYPMLEHYKTMYANVIDETSSAYKAPFNQKFDETKLYTPKDTLIITPNSDTLYTVLWMDLRTEPQVLSIPAIDERYFSFQLNDAYTYNFDYIGSRTTGDKGGTFLFVGPNWNGDIPEGITKVLEPETEIIFTLGRTQVFSNDDLDAAISIMDDYKIQPLSQYLKQDSPIPAPKIDFISWSDEKANSEEFINYLNLILTYTPIHPSDKELFEKFEKIGITSGDQVDFKQMDPKIKDAIALGVDSAITKIEEKMNDLGEFENGWGKTVAFGDRDFYSGNYLLRAGAGMFGLFGNTLEEAFYPQGLSDKDQNPMDASKNNYVIKFTKEPPVEGFWSVTMYDRETRLLVENSIDRWLINNVSDLQKNKDGSFEVYLQHESPGEDKENNWLPTPDGPFHVVMRLYHPDQSVIDQTWVLPIIEKVE